MAKAKSDKLTLKHIIGYGAGDCGGCFGLYMVSMYMARFLQVNLGVNAALLATILLVWNVWVTFAPSRVIRLAMIRPISPEPRITTSLPTL